MNSSNRILILVQTHAHAAALMGCIPHLRANYGWVWAVYSPAVLADPALVEKEFDNQIADLTRAMKDCYAREDGAGGDQYKAKRDAAILEKTAKVKDAWKSLSKDAQDAAVMKMFKPFFDAIQGVEGMSCAISQATDHFETAAHVEMQNSLKAGMKPGYVPGEYVVAWPTSLPKGGSILTDDWKKIAEQEAKKLAQDVKNPPPTVPVSAFADVATPVVKVDKRTKEYKARLAELKAMTLDDLGPIAFELGIKPNDPVAGKRDDLIEKIIELEQAKREVDAM
jgi:hypothetical protein